MFDSKTCSIRFDENSVNWTDDQKFDECFLNMQLLYLKNLLSNRGYLFVRDIYELLGMPITSDSIVAGWHQNGCLKDVDFDLIHFPERNYFVILFEAETDIRKYF